MTIGYVASIQEDFRRLLLALLEHVVSADKVDDDGLSALHILCLNPDAEVSHVSLPRHT